MRFDDAREADKDAIENTKDATQYAAEDAQDAADNAAEKAEDFAGTACDKAQEADENISIAARDVYEDCKKKVTEKWTMDNVDGKELARGAAGNTKDTAHNIVEDARYAAGNAADEAQDLA